MTDDKSMDPGATWAFRRYPDSGKSVRRPESLRPHRLSITVPPRVHCPVLTRVSGPEVEAFSWVLFEFTGGNGGPVARDFGTDWRMGKKFCNT